MVAQQGMIKLDRRQKQIVAVRKPISAIHALQQPVVPPCSRSTHANNTHARIQHATTLHDTFLAPRQVVVLVGAGAGAGVVRKALQAAQREQNRLVCELEDANARAPAGRRRVGRIAVDGVFAKRLLRILKMCATVHGAPVCTAPRASQQQRIHPLLTTRCVPGVFSPEAGLIAVQGALLVSRTLLTDYISRIEAKAGRQLIQQVCVCVGGEKDA